MNTTTVTGIDPELKQEAQKTARSRGMSLSGLVNKLFKDFVKTKKRDYFEEKPSPYLEKILRHTGRDRSHDSPTFDNAKDAIKWLENQGI